MTIVTLETDKETGDLILPIPSEILIEMGWDIGDTLLWNVDDNGVITLSKKEEATE